MKMKNGFLIDMDGVIYRGSELVPGANLFIRKLLDLNLPFIFVTNNSQRTPRDVATKLRRMGITVDDKHVFTCAVATAQFLAKQKPRGTAYVIGEGGLLAALDACGYSVVDRDPDYVVVGEGRTVTMEMMDNAVRMIVNGAKLIATNMDANCPTQHGLRLGCGAIVAMLEKATGVNAFSVGKPSPVILREARKALRISTVQTTFIGDTMETDIVGGVQMGYRTILVLSGGTSRADLVKYAYRPDIIVDSIADLLNSDILTAPPTEEIDLMESNLYFVETDEKEEESQKVGADEDSR
jgi:NagD protein